MTSDFPRLMKILGYDFEDESDSAEIARTWINGTLDEDETWFDNRPDHEIKNRFQRWVRMVYNAHS